jgi:hypothetical protein
MRSEHLNHGNRGRSCCYSVRRNRFSRSPYCSASSYGLDPVNQFQQGAGYVDRILRGAKPADLPVQYPTKLQLVVNLKTVGLTIPESFCSAPTR